LKERLINSNDVLLMTKLPIGGLGSFTLDEEEFLGYARQRITGKFICSRSSRAERKKGELGD
jgi:hypothetical protein